MSRGILLVGNESPLFSAVEGEALKRAESIVSVPIVNRITGSNSPKEAEKAIKLPWNPSSAISAKTLILAAENRLKKISDAVLICSPPAVFKDPENLNPNEIEILVEDHIKGWFYLIRELILYFSNEKSGILALAVPEINAGLESRSKKSNQVNNELDLLGPSAAASFYNYAQSIISSSILKPYRIIGFTGSHAGLEDQYAAWLFKTIDEAEQKNHRSWQQYQRRGLFK